jgi:hypothetical protein
MAGKEPHAVAAGVFYAASNMGLYRSGDGGESWKSVPMT